MRELDIGAMLPAMASPPAQLSLLGHHNHFLFSSYYLDHRVRERPEWRAGEVAAAFERITELWRAYLPNGDNESQTEHDWIRPVLDALGHKYIVQVPLRTPLGTRKPDYILYPDDASRQSAKGGVLEEADLRGALAVADAKAWELPLDRAIKPGPGRAAPEVSANPSFQIDFYIRHTGLPWGILTNGRHWRLYHRDTSKKLDVYYEVDLPDLIEQGDVDAFGYFFHFFRREAFTGPPTWLDQVLEESRAYEQGVGENLKSQVYDALRSLAQGFLDFPANKLAPTPENLQAIHDHSLIVLYRLLFTLYAESRGLLPLHENDAYTRSYSLFALKNAIANDLRRGAPAVASMDALWSQLKQQWHVLAAGNPDLGVPAYNGGLFDPSKHPFLEQYRVGDLHLRQAIDLVARTADRSTGKREFVDYRDLEVRHLGSIYEGLLEYRVRFATEPLTVHKERGHELYAPAAPSETPTIPAATVYLATDKGERKATGSYYTPEYIVQYIVEHTVGPVLDELRTQHAGNEAALVPAVLALNVLDPSMGSGHFLVAATDFIARFLVAAELKSPETSDGEADLAYWRRRVAQGCIYGVDLNPLAVELAKLSLWLATVARDKPLSFLDHHLRCGNSLIGARVRDLGTAPAAKKKPGRTTKQARDEAEAGVAQLSMLTDSAFAGAMSAATGLMTDLESITGDTLAEVHEAEALFHRVQREVTRKYRVLADIWTARHFGLSVDATLWAGLAAHVTRGGFQLPQYAGIVDQAQAIATERRFFHWELEFPEVFFDKYGRLMEEAGGFDAVVGNPPYVRQEGLGDVKPYFATVLSDVYHGTADIFVYFIGQGLGLLKTDRRLSYISSNSWLRANYATPLRHFLREHVTVDEIIDLGDNRAFPDVPDVYPAIIVTRRTQPSSYHAAEAAVFTRGEGLAEFDRQVREKGAAVSIHDQSDNGWQLGDDAGRRLLAKLIAGGTPFGEVVGGRIYYGIKTGLNEAFIIDTPTRDRLVAEDSKSREFVKPLANGEDVRSWHLEDAGRWLIALPNSWTRGALGPYSSEDAAWWH